MRNDFTNGIWTSVQFLVCSHNETELAKLLVKECGLTRQDCLRAQEDSDFETETMLKFIDSVFHCHSFPHCSQCKHYEILSNYNMYCDILKRKITVRKRPCKYYQEEE